MAGGSPELDLPHGLDTQHAVEINKLAQRFDGIEDVTSGAVRSTDQARDAFRAIVGSELPDVTLENVAGVASETVSRLNSKYDLGLSL
jgi:hypothetical protein